MVKLIIFEFSKLLFNIFLNFSVLNFENSLIFQID